MTQCLGLQWYFDSALKSMISKWVLAYLVRHINSDILNKNKQKKYSEKVSKYAKKYLMNNLGK